MKRRKTLQGREEEGAKKEAKRGEEESVWKGVRRERKGKDLNVTEYERLNKGKY